MYWKVGSESSCAIPLDVEWVGFCVDSATSDIASSRGFSCASLWSIGSGRLSYTNLMCDMRNRRLMSWIRNVKLKTWLLVVHSWIGRRHPLSKLNIHPSYSGKGRHASMCGHSPHPWMHYTSYDFAFKIPNHSSLCTHHAICLRCSSVSQCYIAICYIKANMPSTLLRNTAL